MILRDRLTMMEVKDETGFARKVADRIVFMEAGAIVKDTQAANFLEGRNRNAHGNCARASLRIEFI